MLAGSRIQLQQPAGLGGSRLQRAAAPVAAAARLGSALPAGLLQARPAAARRADRSALRVSATASPEAAPVKLSGDDLKEANRKQMRSVRSLPPVAVSAHTPGHPACSAVQPASATKQHAAACQQLHVSALQHAVLMPRSISWGSGGSGDPTTPPTPPGGHPSQLTPPLPACPPVPAAQVFDFDLWKKHRSSSRYLRHIVGLGESRIVSRSPQFKLETTCCLSLVPSVLARAACVLPACLLTPSSSTLPVLSSFCGVPAAFSGWAPHPRAGPPTSPLAPTSRPARRCPASWPL